MNLEDLESLRPIRNRAISSIIDEFLNLEVWIWKWNRVENPIVFLIDFDLQRNMTVHLSLKGSFCLDLYLFTTYVTCPVYMKNLSNFEKRVICISFEDFLIFFLWLGIYLSCIGTIIRLFIHPDYSPILTRKRVNLPILELSKLSFNNFTGLVRS